MTSETPISAPWRLSVIDLLRGLAFVWGLFIVGCNLANLSDNLQGRPTQGTLGTAFTLHGAPGGAYGVAGDVTPGSSAALAGIHAGDHVRFDHTPDAHRVQIAGQAMGMTILSPTPRHVVLAILPMPWPGRLAMSWQIGIDGVSALLGSLTGLFVLWRSRGAPSLIALGSLFPTLSLTYCTAVGADPLLYSLWDGLFCLCDVAGPVFELAFVILFYRENVGPVSRRAGVALGAYTAIVGVTGVGLLALFLEGRSLLFHGFDQPVYAVVSTVGELAAVAGLVYSWWRSAREIRRRYAVMLVGIACFTLFALIGTFGQTLGLSLFDMRIYVPFELLAVMAPLIFAYAVLRNRVLDLGFAVNRTLVYGVVSVVLLLAFGLIEWASEKFIPIESREKNLFIDAGIALGIFLTFHRLRDFAEENIEKLFFRRWHHNEAKLRRFVKEAGFIGKRETLNADFAAELKRFSGGASISLYTAEGDAFLHADGAGRIDADDPVVVAMKAEGGAVDLVETRSALAASLALPMLHRSELTGFVLLGLKPGGGNYRPDEREVLAWATHQIGLDLHALQIEALQRETAFQKQEIAVLRTLVQPQRAPA